MSFSFRTRPTLRPAAPRRALLVFNPVAGVMADSPFQLLEILTRLQAARIHAEVHLVSSQMDSETVVASALKRGIRLVIVAGGDGTIESIAGPLVGSSAVLGIIPTGTRNNIALSLGIPTDITGAVTLLNDGPKLKMDIGHAQCGDSARWFIETSSVGLVPALYPAADDIQHGNLARIGDLLTTLFTSPLADIRMFLDDGQEQTFPAHVALIANLPYFGANYQISPDISFTDHWLDVFIFSELTKLELMGYAVASTVLGVVDTRIKHYRVRKVVMSTQPEMPVMADGFNLGDGTLVASVRPAGLSVVAGVDLPGPDQAETA